MNILKRACDKQLGKNISKSGGKVCAQLRDVSSPSPTRSAWREQSAKGCVAPARAQSSTRLRSASASRRRFAPSPTGHLQKWRSSSVAAFKAAGSGAGRPHQRGHLEHEFFERFSSEARSRLYRSHILQINMRWKSLAEIFKMHSFAPFWNRITVLVESVK